MTAQSGNVLIVGGGPAGAATAVLLARRGIAVEIFEQSAGAHHKVCGEFLSHEAIEYLEGLSVNPRALGAVSIRGVRLAAKKEIAASELPFAALSLTRRRLDEVLLSRAAEAGAIVYRGKRVDALARRGSRWVARMAGGEEHRAQTVFLATGKHDVSGQRRPRGAQNDLVAFKMYFRLREAQQQALDGWVELFVFPGGYAGLQLAEDGGANLCLLVNRRTLERLQPGWPALLNHLRRSSDLLKERLDGAESLLAKPLALSSIPYGMLCRDSEPGLWRLGDQAAVIPSFSGDGISIALHSARLASEYYASGRTSIEFARRLYDDVSRSVRRATAISRLLIAAPAMAQAARLWPPLLSLIAARTRIPVKAVMAEAIRN